MTQGKEGDEIRTEKPNYRKRPGNAGRPGAKYLLLALLLLCVIALPISVGKTYAVITVATNVSVNTFYGEETEDNGETEEPGDDGGDTGGEEEPDTDEPDTEEPDTSEPDTEEPSTDEENPSSSDTSEYTSGEMDTENSGSTGSGTSGTSDTDSTNGAQTGDSTNLLIWIVICIAALIGIVAIGLKMLRDNRRRE